jgi:hypothetical protein
METPHTHSNGYGRFAVTIHQTSQAPNEGEKLRTFEDFNRQKRKREKAALHSQQEDKEWKRRSGK